MASLKPATKYLGQQFGKSVKKFDLIPWLGSRITVTLNCTEFTSHCPVTGQPDFAKLVIEYVPNKFIVETKSMKLYLWQFRSKKEFNEKLVNFIANDFAKQVKPVSIRVVGEFYTRGGIAVTAESIVGSGWRSRI